MRIAKALVVSTVTCLALSMSAGVALADEPDTLLTSWKKSLVTDLTLTQTSYSDSWEGGEVGSFNWQANANGSAERDLSPKFNFKTTLKISYGQTNSQDAETKKWSKPVKSTDLIDWENVGRFNLQAFVDPYVAFRLETRFYDGRVRSMKQWFSPLKFTESAGIARTFYKKKDDFISSRLGLALRQIMKSVVSVDSTGPVCAYSANDSTLTDGGFESVTDLGLSFHKNLRYTGKLTLYKAVFFSKSDEVKGTPYEDDWKSIDVDFENIIAASVTKVIAVIFYTQLLYDKEVVDRGRFKQTLAIGFTYKMF